MREARTLTDIGPGEVCAVDTLQNERSSPE